MEKITDKYGNIKYTFDELKDKMVTTGKVNFYIKKIHINNGLIEIDGSKPFELLDKTYAMKNCIEQGNYAVMKDLVYLLDSELN